MSYFTISGRGPDEWFSRLVSVMHLKNVIFLDRSRYWNIGFVVSLQLLFEAKNENLREKRFYRESNGRRDWRGSFFVEHRIVSF